MSLTYDTQFSCKKCANILSLLVVKMGGDKLVIKGRCSTHGGQVIKLPVAELNQYINNIQKGVFRCYKCGAEAKLDHTKVSGPWNLVRMVCPTHSNNLPYQKIWSSIYSQIQQPLEAVPPKIIQAEPPQPKVVVQEPAAPEIAAPEPEETTAPAPVIPEPTPPKTTAPKPVTPEPETIKIPSDVPLIEPKMSKNTRVIYCPSDWDATNIKAVIESFCGSYTVEGKITITELEPYVLEAKTSSASKAGKFLGTSTDYSGIFRIGASPTRGWYVQIDYEEASAFKSGSFGKKKVKIFWDGVHKGLSSVLSKPLSSFE
ncbi:MAG: hypothetical protein ACFFCM_21190 [Promethearchaeota archaeon]